MEIQEQPDKLAVPSDESLMTSAQSGDFDAFQELTRRFQPRVFGLTFRILGQAQDAEDATQQTFLSMIEHLESFRGEASVATWILRIATNHALKLLRKRNRGPILTPFESTASDDSAPLPHPDFIAPWSIPPDELAARSEVQQNIHKALADLDEKYRTVFTLRDIEGFSVKETAGILQITESSVKVRLLRARLMLRERLTRMYGDEAGQLFPSHDHG